MSAASAIFNASPVRITLRNNLSRPSVLIVDDAPDNLRLLTQLLEGEEYDVRIAPSGRFALESVRGSPPDLILLDIKLPDVDGLEVCRIIKGEETTQHIPIIFLTALTATEDEVKGLELGAVDYIHKPFNAHIVRVRVRNHMRYIRQRKLLEQLAHIDPLTEIPNRRGFQNVLKREWGRARREQSPLSFAIADVDRFKQLNDSFGHPEGDRALRLMASTLAACEKRPGDVVARHGGDEFVILLPNTDEVGAHAIADQMCRAVADLEIGYAKEPSQGKLTLSIGGVTIIPADDRDPEQRLQQADENLYSAKKAGGDRVVWSRASVD